MTTESIFEPSSGGTGSRLKTARPMLIVAAKSKKLAETCQTICGEFIIARTAPFLKRRKRKAIMRLETGPARAVRAIPSFGFLKFLALTLTGFA